MKRLALDAVPAGIEYQTPSASAPRDCRIFAPDAAAHLSVVLRLTELRWYLHTLQCVPRRRYEKDIGTDALETPPNLQCE
jgi:hypothetical protein